MKRPGGRSARVRSAVLAATIDELADVGVANLTVEGIAQRAGVHKATIYRRWGDRETLLLEAMLERGMTHVPIPDTGSLRQDLIAYAAEIAANVAAPKVDAVVRSVASVGVGDSKLTEASRTFWTQRRATAGQMLERAVARGEISESVDGSLVLEAIIAPIYFRLLISREPVDKPFLERLVSLVTAAYVSG